jgi:hypothetical protein
VPTHPESRLIIQTTASKARDIIAALALLVAVTWLDFETGDEISV